MDAAFVELTLQDISYQAYVVFGDENDAIVIGRMTLEYFALAANARNHCLIPARLTLLSSPHSNLA